MGPVSSTPPDLRVVNKGLLQRLFPASAGLPGDDNTDIRLIRDEWIRDQARSLSQRGKRRISVHLGTFNVNGKLPSQDLSLWIQGTRTSDAPAHKKGISLSLPPIQMTSPISLEETAKQHSSKQYQFILSGQTHPDAVTSYTWNFDIHPRH